ncbi:NAD(P)/FAD-dependent oxidoreductase [Reinekea blandensis]|uniref:Probable amino acid dehydrogenase transmembrane protein n=1 Tax=Reinekea blandensis MED297 TaxID=314283 RepID=A4BD20_9GAMM|nr:FAD-binding oxidoreductase [Reinekea blandensis]EAR10102.1 probable amino acid dehydrogenase transmembrane protein [Reinekea sp. MED297] [Reinekea blandensis MED297]
MPSQPSATHKDTHLIIGAGIIGLMTALHLQQAGRDVHLVDRTLPGDVDQASYGNAGVLSFASYRPVAEPGIWKEGLHGLFDPNSVLKLNWRYLPTAAPWLWAFLKESHPTRADANARATLSLNGHAKKSWQAVVRQHRLNDLVEPTGWLKLFESDAAFNGQMAQTAALDEAGLGWQSLTGDEVRDLEPAVGTRIKHGFLQTDSLRVRQPHHLLNRLAEHLRTNGATFHRAQVQSLQAGEHGVTVQTDQGSLSHAQVCLCAGAYSQRLLATLGEQVPLETERGYHLMMPVTDALTRPIMHVEEQFVVSPMAEGLRMTTGEEFAGLDAPPDYRLIQRKHKRLNNLLPGLDLTPSHHWLGFRPSFPDSKPIIARHPTLPGLAMAFGHGHLGMTQSAATGVLLSELVLDQRPSVDLSPFRFDRFA